MATSYDETALLSPPPLLPPRAARSPQVLVVDDQDDIRSLLSDVLKTQHCLVSGAQNRGEAEVLLRTEDFDAIIVDIFLGADESGLDLLPRIRQLQPNTPTIVISGMASMDHVMEALKAGAYDMLCKPFNIIDVINVVARAVDKKRMSDENERLVQALRHERDLLEERVHAATHDLEEKVETLRLLNEQVATMFEMSQMPSGHGSSEAVVRRIFEHLHRLIDFEGAFCVVYDIKARDINLSCMEAESVHELCQTMAGVFRSHGASLAELAESQEHLPIEDMQATLRQLYPGEWPKEDVMLMPLHVHQTLIGVVGLIRRRRSQHLTPVEERILAIVISNFLAALEQRNYIARTGQLTGLGELISEIAHDLRHPLTALRGASHILLDGWRDETKRVRCIEEIHGNLGRMESLVTELVTFYNPREMNMIPVDLHALLNKALSVSQAILEQKQIVVERQFSADPLTILGLSRNLMEAFINLISNACNAMESGGRLTVATFGELNPKQHVRLSQTGRQPASYIMVKITDTGCGIPEEHLDRVFLRFFTTRPEGHGLGLSAVQRIVKKSLGHIYFESTVGQGTTFYLYLPKA